MVDEGGGVADRLDGLAEAHLVGQDDVLPLRVRVQQPADALQLVRVQRQ